MSKPNERFFVQAYQYLAKDNNNYHGGAFPTTQADFEASDLWQDTFSWADLCLRTEYYKRMDSLAELRHSRDVMLGMQDHIILRSITSGEPLSDEWKQWFQDMRDITDTYTTLEEAEFPLPPNHNFDDAEPLSMAKMDANTVIDWM
jgi:hypothetical protein